MKKLINYLGIPLLMAGLVLTSCQTELTEEEFRESLSEIKQEMQIASGWIEEAIEAETSGELILKSDMALNKIEAQLDNYLDEMDRAIRRIYKDTRTNIINIKQKTVEIDFRLSLLENTERVRRIGMTEDPDEAPTIRRTRPIGYQFPYAITPDEEMVTERIQYGEEVVDELRKNLTSLQEEVDLFIENSL
jgi:hypothetical protein